MLTRNRACCASFRTTTEHAALKRFRCRFRLGARKSFCLGGLVFKRSLDFSLAGILLVFMLPILAVAAVIIKWDSDGPILFRQVRMGRNFRRFQLLKLRSMFEASAGLPFILGPDKRITRIGRWLRRFKIDELPQLWNVLRGDMSLVGPRPVVPEIVKEFHRSYERLLEKRPGLTDPATLKYIRETEMLAAVRDPLRYFKSVVTPDKLLISRAYQERATVWSDLGVIAATGWGLFRSCLLTQREPPERPLAPVFVFPRPAQSTPAPQRTGSQRAKNPARRTAATRRRSGYARVELSPVVYKHLQRNPRADTPDPLRLAP
jgi:lipopolysaccharide/colanic/teichoic acid biosynthesis glycosyltransferase